MLRGKSVISTSLFALFISLAAPAMAQAGGADEAGGFEDIVVTAEKRSTSLQNTPIASTALQGSALATQQVTSVALISRGSYRASS